jgi:hypothetical protein
LPKQEVTIELFYDGAWQDLTADDEVFSDPIVIKRGQSDEGSAFRPCTIACSLNNASDKFRVSNPLSPLYGKAGRNTPLRVSVGGTVRGIAEASSWVADQDQDFRAYPPRGKAWVDVDAGGVLQRVGQWTEPLRSAFRYFNDQISGLVGYWPMEDARGALLARSALDGTENVGMVGQSFGSQNSPPGGGTGVDVGSGSAAGFQFTPGNVASTAGWEYSVAVYLGDMESSVAWSTMTAHAMNGIHVSAFVSESDQSLDLQITDASFSSLFDTTFSTGVSFRGRWVLWHMRCTVAAGTVTVGVSWRGVDDPGWVGVSGTYSGTVTSDLYQAFVNLPPGSTYGHVIGAAGAPNLDSSGRFDAFLGHPGELAAVRFGRLLDQEGIGYYVSDGWASSMPMGPQRPDPLPNHLKEIVDTEDGLLFDHGSELKLFLLCRADRTNQTPALTLTPADLPKLPAEATDDLGTANVVTASQHDGGDVTAIDDTGPLGTQPPPAGIGEKKQTVNVNVADEASDLPQVANWWLRRGTVNLPRYPQLTIDLNALNAQPSLIADIEAIDVGAVIEITDFREYTVRLHVLGWTETPGTHTRIITFTCAPDQQFNVGVLDANRLQASFTVVFPALDATATTLTLFTGEPGEQWRTGSNGVHILLGGEEIILGTVGARTGTNPYSQVVTGCTRAVNGIRKAHGITELVKVKDAIRLTL